VSTVFAAVHHHDASFDDQHCAACSWHHDGTVDEPTVAPAIIRPETILVVPESPCLFLRELSRQIHPNRGPPSFLR
jgi:hypothetical protein